MNSQDTSQRQSRFVRDEQFECARRRRTSSFLWTALWSLVVLLVLSSDSFAQSALTDDAHVSLSSGSANHGTNPNLSVSAGESTYLKFKLASTLPASTPGSEVGRATLKIYIGSIQTAGKLDVYAVSGAWEESTITANNLPALGSLVTTTAQIGEDKQGKFFVIDITSLVQQWLGDDGQGTNGIANNGLALVAHPIDAMTPAVASITFDSKENSQTSHEAQLNVQLDGAADGLQIVEHDASLTGDGTIASPLGVADGGITTVHLANDAVTGDKIADNAVTSTELADGSVTSPKIRAPLSLTSADAGFTLSVANTGAGAAITAKGAIDTTTQYNIGGNRILSNPGNNLFAGVGAGASNTTGGANTYFGGNAGLANTIGSNNSFFGLNVGRNTTSSFNSFFGDGAGLNNTAGGDSFYGYLAGFSNTTGNENAFFGRAAGFANTTGGANSFFGHETGSRNTTGASNSFFGRTSGFTNTTGTNNSFFGVGAGAGNTVGSVNTFLGSSAGASNTTGQSNTFVGYAAARQNNTTGNNLTVIGAFASVGADNLDHATAIGAYAVVNTSNTVVLGRNADTVQVPGALNVAGTFGANILDAATQFNLGGNRVLSISGGQGDPNSNMFVGVGAGASNTTGLANSFFGIGAGSQNTGGNLNDFFGRAAGAGNSTGSLNSFFGSYAGFQNTTGSENAFFGNGAGFNNTTGFHNSFFGRSTGQSNSTGNSNSFFGFEAGRETFSGGDNSFFGTNAGRNNNTGSSNSFFGRNSGTLNTTGNFNTFIGKDTGLNNTVGSNLTVIGASANLGANNLTFATAIGAGAVVSTSNTVVLGRSADTVQVPGSLNIGGAFGANILNATTQYNLGGVRILSRTNNENLFAGVSSGPNTTGLGNVFFGPLSGITATTGTNNSFFGLRAGATATGSGNSFFGRLAGGNFTGTGNNNTFIGHNADFDVSSAPGSNNTLLGANANVHVIGFGQDLSFATAIGAGAAVQFSDMVVIGKAAGTYDGVARPADIVRTMGIFQPALSSPGGNPVCFNNGLSLCSSSLRYKTGIRSYLGGLDVAKRLNPITFSWKADGRSDIGFGAEDVVKIEPLLTFTNEKGELEGVHYAQITTVLVNSIKEQQAQIEAQQEQLKQQQQQIDVLKQLVSRRRANRRGHKSAPR